MNFRSQSLAQFAHYAYSRRVLLVGASIPLLVIAAQLLRLSTLEGDRYAAMAADNLETNVRLQAPRGNVLDRRGRVVATNRRTWTVSYSAYRQKDDVARATLDRLATLLGESMRMSPDAILAETPRTKRHIVARRLEQTQVLPLIERASEFPGVRLQEDFRREYAYPTTLSLVLGHVGRIPEGQEEAFPSPRYRPDDEVGRAGLEAALEDRLAGQPGRERLKRDARGRLLDEPELLEQARAGSDLTLTIDAEVQRRAYELLRGETGSVIVMEVTTGDVVVMASTPTYDAAQPGANMVEGREAGFVNRASRGLYPPASTFKLIGAAAVLRSGITPEESVDCEGSVTLPGWRRPFWCNVRTGHGPLTLSGALKVSCNSYFYVMAQRLGPEPFLREAQMFGFGTRTGIEIPEAPGSLPAIEKLTPGELTNFSIGQGTFLATPLQVVRAVAGIADGRQLPVPRLIRAIDGAEPAPVAGTPIDLPPSMRSAIIAGMERAVNEPGGTVYKAQLPASWRVVGKSGTAENATGGVDAWFAGFLPREAPRWAFLVQIESADGHGGEVAGPIGRDVLRALLEAEEAARLPRAEASPAPANAVLVDEPPAPVP